MQSCLANADKQGGKVEPLSPSADDIACGATLFASGQVGLSWLQSSRDDSERENGHRLQLPRRDVHVIIATSRKDSSSHISRF